MKRLCGKLASLLRLRIGWPAWLAGLLCALLSQTPWWQSVETQGFDALTRLSAPRSTNLPITIISIDEQSMAAIGRQWPWPRQLHARLLQQLQQAQVAVVGFDILFAEAAADPAGDLAFEQAIRSAGPVILAADIEYRETAASRQWLRVDPLPRYLQAGASAGLAAVELDRDGVLRRFPGSAAAFWRQVLQRFDLLLPGVVASQSLLPQQRIRYLGGAGTFSSIPYYQMLDPDKYLPRDWRTLLRDNIVLIGRNLKSTTHAGAAQSDLFLTPFVAEGGQLMSGVEVHANLIANMVEGRQLRPLPTIWPLALIALATLASAWLLGNWHPLRSLLLAGGLILLLAALCTSLFYRDLWLPGVAAMLTALLSYIGLGGRAFLLEQAQRRRIRREFEHYVAPAVVATLLAHPEQLRLGGQRCELTILFTDLAGFTALAEQMDSEAVARVLNQHLSDMSDIVIRHHGTIDKFIGDSVMAFWGAPIADAQQSQHALAAALQMQQSVAELRRQLAGEGGPQLTMRIGLHRGECVVGNMGGANHFAYTAVGDSVNLASRLEGANKAYGTGILLSASVVASLGPGAAVRPVDCIRVAGRQQPVDIYTPCNDVSQQASTVVALAAYRSGDLSAAHSAWQALAQDYPDDPLPAVFLARLQQWQGGGVPTDWDGVTRLGK